MAKYSDGTVAVTQSSQVVAGSGTAWKHAVAVGADFRVDGGPGYVVAAVVNDTELRLSAPYAGATETGVVYSVSTDFSGALGLPLPERGDVDLASVARRAFIRWDGQ